MRTEGTGSLFAWDTLEDSPSLRTVKAFLESVPDQALIRSLAQARGRGRDDYPVPVLWGTLLVTILLRHTSFEACLAELSRNEGLRRLIGIDHAGGVPKKWNMSRFLRTLGTEPHWTLLQKVFDDMVASLGGEVPELGRRTAGDSTALCARRTRSEQSPESDLPEPSGGRKEYRDDDGKVTKILEWFGYKLHLLVDVDGEVVLAYRITTPSVGDNEQIMPVTRQAVANLGDRRIETLAFDKAADDAKVHEDLAEAGIKPVVQMRAMWKSEPERMLPHHDGSSNVVYDEAGTIYCYDKKSDPPVRHRMAYIGHEAARETLKYRCPAVHEGWSCPSEAICNAGRSYGKTVRVDQRIDLRRFPPIPRATKQFERLYKGRTAVERVNARLKIFWGMDDGNIVGPQRFHAFVGAIMVVHIGLATLLAKSGTRSGKTFGTMHLSRVASSARTP